MVLNWFLMYMYLGNKNIDFKTSAGPWKKIPEWALGKFCGSKLVFNVYVFR